MAHRARTDLERFAHRIRAATAELRQEGRLERVGKGHYRLVPVAGTEASA